MQVKLPFTSFHGLFNGTDVDSFDPRNLFSLTFTQGLDDDREHVLYLDDFQIRNIASADTTAPPAPGGVKVRGWERHVDVIWQPSVAPDLLAYRIYRSRDGKTFEPAGTQQGSRTRWVDFLGAPERRAFYRVTALDLSGNESSPSPAAEVGTHAMTDDELLSMVQEGCFRYYWEGGHPAAGLAPELLPGDPDLIAIGGNGFGVMALLVAAERQFVTRDQATERMLKILHFLSRADRFHGRKFARLWMTSVLKRIAIVHIELYGMMV